jgi:tetratricopeptide (TPR) repeat protein
MRHAASPREHEAEASAAERTSEQNTPTVAPSGEATVATSASSPSLALRRYELGEEIARGGMGVIYRGTDTVLGREVALKVLQDTYAAGSAVARRFADEARIAAQLQHPAIPPIHDLGTLPDGRPFLAMKLIKGETLDALLAARPDPAHERGSFIAVFEQVCQALAYAHAHAVIHRDLKPANIMVGSFGEAQVMDWGLAKILSASAGRQPPESDQDETTAGTLVVSLRDSDEQFTQAGSILGTPAFMPPEQAAGAVGKIDARSDVFGLGAILAVILTGEPPFRGASVETTRVQAAQGKVRECFARLDACGAHPDLIALCKRCLAPENDNRPADAGEVAKEVAQLRAAADERARQAELERVRIEGEQATAEAKAAERHKRRRLWLGSAAVLGVAVVGGLAAVLAVQRRANAELEAKNFELAQQRAEVGAKNIELAQQQAEVEARFAMAQKAIDTFHTTVSEDGLLKKEEFKELRTTLLKKAAGFYAELEKLLAGKTDVKSRRLLATGYYQLGRLTEDIGDKTEALAVHRKALALRRELAAAPGADVEARLDVALSLQVVAGLLRQTGDRAGALAAFEELRDLAAALTTDAPTDYLAAAYNGIGLVLSETGKLAEALKAYAQARDLVQKLVDANPAGTRFQSDLAWSHSNIGTLLAQTGELVEALKAYEKARDLREKLVDANPAVTEFQSALAGSHYRIGEVLQQTGELVKALKAYEKARDAYQELRDANPAVTEFQSDLARSHHGIGNLLLQTGKPAEALRAYEQARDRQQKLADANPAVTSFQSNLARSHYAIGYSLKQMGKPAEALKAFEQARDRQQKLADANPAVTSFQSELARSYIAIANSLLAMGKAVEALKAYEKARELQQKLADANPTVAFFQSELVYSHNNIGLVLRQTGKPAEALKAHEEARAVVQKLADAQPTFPDYQRLLAEIQNDRGRLLAELRQFPEAFAALDTGLALRRKLAESYPTVPSYVNDLGYSHAYRGRSHVRAGHPTEAAADLRRALELWAGNKTSNDEDHFERARAQALLAGLGAQVKSGVSAAEAAAFADKAIAALRDAMQAGSTNVAELKEPDFDALRQRDDFQKLAKQLEARGRAPTP